jgi:hypothetical protein
MRTHDRAPAARGQHRALARAVSALAATATATLLLAGCDSGGGTGAVDDSEPSRSAPGARAGSAASPLDNLDGTRPGLAAITSDADRAKARALIDKVKTKGRGPRTGYDRDEFGEAWSDTAPGGIPYARNGCDTRNDVLKRDGEDLRYRSGSDCVLVSLTLHDPYTGRTIDWTKADADAVQIDHVAPLSYNWQMGASGWTPGKREAVANDPLNLMPVDGPVNSRKSDSGPAAWLPPNKQIRCSYAVRFAQVALKYEMPVTTADKNAMLRQCGG